MNSSEEKPYSTGKAARALRVNPMTVFRWIHRGKIRATMNPAGRWLVPQSEIDRLLGIKREEKQRVIIYARVSSDSQREHLLNQVKRLRGYADKKGYIVVKTYQEIGSGLNERRRKLEQVYNMVRRREADAVLVEFKDRLSRFGFNYLAQLAESYGGRVEVVEDDVKKDAMQELVEDMISIVSSFSARLYGYRSQKFKRITEVVKYAVHA